MTAKKTCIIICGPTAVGKTGVAVSLAKKFATEIISADSRQCYRELNIGVAKPTDEELASVPHFFISSHSILDEINVAGFEKYASSVVSRILDSKDVAVMVGGTGLYINAFCNGLDDISEIDPLVRNSIREDYKVKGLEWLRESLIGIDPDFAASDDMSNPQRMMRALEVISSTGKSIRSFQNRSKRSHDYRIIKIGLELPRAELYDRINHRVDQMIESGLLQEVESLLSHKNLNALNTVGYKELFNYLSGENSLDKAIELIKQNTRNYAKRQLTWFKRDPETTWFSPFQLAEIIDYLQVS